MSCKCVCEYDVWLIGGFFNRNEFYNCIVVGVDVVWVDFSFFLVGVVVWVVMDLCFFNGGNLVSVGLWNVLVYLKGLVYVCFRCKDVVKFVCEGNGFIKGLNFGVEVFVVECGGIVLRFLDSIFWCNFFFIVWDWSLDVLEWNICVMYGWRV